MQEEMTIERATIQSASVGNINLLENIILTSQLNQATCVFIHEHAKQIAEHNAKQAQRLLAQGYHGTSVIESYHSSLTLLGFVKTKALLEKENGFDQTAGLTCLEQAAQAGNPWAMYLAGNCYRDGVGCEVDKPKAQNYYLCAYRRLQTKKVVEDALVNALSGGGAKYYVQAYLEHMLCSQNPSRLASDYADNTNQLKRFVIFTVMSDDPFFTPELKYQCCVQLFHQPFNLEKEQSVDFVLAWGILYAQEAQRMLPQKEMDKYEMALHNSKLCLKQLNKLGAGDDIIKRLETLIHRTTYKEVELCTDFKNPRQAAASVIRLLAHVKDPVGAFSLAKAIGEINTDDIFINRVNKFRVMLVLLSQVELEDRNQCEGYDEILAKVARHLLPGKEGFLFVKFDLLASVIMGRHVSLDAMVGKIGYQPMLEYDLFKDPQIEEKLHSHFGTVNVKSFQGLFLESYEDCVNELDLEYLKNHLMVKFISHMELAASPSSEQEIDHGDHGAIKFQGVDKKQDQLGLIKIAIKKAVTDFGGVNKHNNAVAVYLFSDNKSKRNAAANHFLAESDLCFTLYDLSNTVVKHLKEAKGRFDPLSFKTILLRYLSEALNLGNIKEIDVDAQRFSLMLCNRMRVLFPKVEVVNPFENDDSDSEKNNNNNNINN